jgi:hypothetical protein
MPVIRLLTLAALLVCVAAPDVAAQVSAFQPGARVRVAIPIRQDLREVKGSSAWQTGVVTESDTTGVTLRLNSGVVSTIPYEVISRAEVSLGAQTSGTGARKGLLRGAAVGAGAAAIVYLLNSAFKNCDVCEGDDCPPCANPKYLGDRFAPVLLGAAGVGAGLGFTLGSQARENWQPVDLPKRSYMVSSAGRGMRVGLTIQL